jgi:hypothetical protein
MTRYATLFLTAFLAACSSGGYGPTDSGTPSPSEGSVSVAVGEQVAVGATGVTIELRAVTEDSRCPLNAVCVWEGNGQVSVTLANGYGSARDATLNTSQEPRRIDFAGLRITLSGLAPHPTGDPIDPADYVATFRIERD